MSKDHSDTDTLGIAPDSATLEHEKSARDLKMPIGDCSQCPYRDSLLAEGHCKPGDACVAVESGRQIFRFFRKNPDLAIDYMEDDFWERRAIVAAFIPLIELNKLITDSDATVRRAVARRIPVMFLSRLMDDPDREVRILVAERLPAARLMKMRFDDDYLVRSMVAQKAPQGTLAHMMNDPDELVRKEVAKRLPKGSHVLMINDPSPVVRRIVVKEIGDRQAIRMLYDEDLIVRLMAVNRVPPDALKLVEDDPGPDVQLAIARRVERGEGLRPGS
ncbi:MAG TPA: 4Fe4S-binding leucine-rich repeat protein [Mariprofundaceae bacterium]|nr:4Fe4S-binding leucine-rich repeat protein [Mariprofundaceae bacterium]